MTHAYLPEIYLKRKTFFIVWLAVDTKNSSSLNTRDSIMNPRTLFRKLEMSVVGAFVLHIYILFKFLFLHIRFRNISDVGCIQSKERLEGV